MENYQAVNDRYNTMLYRRCGESGLHLPSLSLGLWHNFGNVDAFDNFSQIAFTAFDNGITYFDLANNYGPEPGSAEENFGRILRKGLGTYRDELIISTKAGHDMWPGPYGSWGSRKHIMASINQSLKRMGLEYVDIFYSHRPDPDTPMEETMQALSDIVKQGKALYIGLSKYNPEQTLCAVQLLKQYGTPCLIHQDRYSLFDRQVENKLLDTVASQRMGLVAFSPLAQGLLTDRYLNGIPADSRAAKPSGFLKQEQLTTEKINQIRQLNHIALERGQTLAEMSLAWLLKDRRVSSIIIGASSVTQLRNNLKALQSPGFTDDELKQIDTITA